MLNFIAEWARRRDTVHELSALSDRDLADLGIARSDIRTRVAATASARAVSGHGFRSSHDTMAPSWGLHNRRSLTA